MEKNIEGRTGRGGRNEDQTISGAERDGAVVGVNIADETGRLVRYNNGVYYLRRDETVDIIMCQTGLQTYFFTTGL